MVWKSYRNPEFWQKLRRQDWVYVLMRNPLGRLIQIVLPLKDIGIDGEFSLFKRTYYWRDRYAVEHGVQSKKGQVPKVQPKREADPLKEGLPTVLQWRHKKTAALFDWDDPFPQVWVPGGSLHSMTDPGMLDSLGAAKDFRMMLEADSMTRLMRLALMVSIVGILATVGLGFAFYVQSDAINHFSRILGNLTGARGG